jgi:hypothetical protein
MHAEINNDGCDTTKNLDPMNIIIAKFITGLPKPHTLAVLTPFATRPEHLKKGGKTAKKCGFGQICGTLALLMFRWVSICTCNGKLHIYIFTCASTQQYVRAGCMCNM